MAEPLKTISILKINGYSEDTKFEILLHTGTVYNYIYTTLVYKLNLHHAIREKHTIILPNDTNNFCESELVLNS